MWRRMDGCRSASGAVTQYKHPTKPGVVTISGGAGEDLPVGLEKKRL